MHNQKLSEAQQTAIEHVGPLCITAGAGSGKTMVLAQRVAHMVATGQCDPLQLLAVTFSVKAARELRERLTTLIDDSVVSQMSVCTLHALGLRMVRAHGDLLGYRIDHRRRQPLVLSGLERHNALRQAAARAAECLQKGNTPEAANLIARMSVDEISGAISAAKASGHEIMAGESAAAQALAACYAEYQKILQEDNMVDFDDLILQPLRLLQIPEARSFYQDRWTSILVDEFQDTSEAQYQIIRQIAARHGNLTVIGDPCQSIYRFRGAMGADGFNKFLVDFPAARTVYLPHNFRSRGRIVEVADELMAEIKPRQEITHPGGMVAIVRSGSEHDEAQMIADQIARAVSSGFAKHSEIAVLCRTNAQFAPLERALLGGNIPYTIVGQGTFFDRREIRDVLSFLSLSQDWMGDPLALRRIANTPARGLGAEAIKALRGEDPELTIDHLLDSERVAALPAPARAGVRALLDDLRMLAGIAHRPPGEVIERIMADRADGGIGYRAHILNLKQGKEQDAPQDESAAQRIERVRALWRMARQHQSVQEFLDEVDVMSGQDPLSPIGQEKVHVMTLHDSKGLEFPVIFLAGCEESLLPHWFSTGSSLSLEDERRLCYVGFTRAKEALVISYTRARAGRTAMPSRFLRGLPRDLIQRGAPDWRTLGRAAN